MDAKNKLYFGDNLKILREYVPDASVDLIYLDPPFNSSASAHARGGGPFGFAQGRELFERRKSNRDKSGPSADGRERISQVVGNAEKQILRFAQDDKRRAQDDICRTSSNKLTGNGIHRGRQAA